MRMSAIDFKQRVVSNIHQSHTRHKTQDPTNMTYESNGTCTDLVIFSHASPYAESIKLESRIITISDKDILMKQQWKDGGRGGTTLGFGASVYNASIVLANFIESKRKDVRFF